MSLGTTKKISLDFYNNAVVTINAKQHDSDTRYVNVTCTDYGKKVFIDSSSAAYARYKNKNGTSFIEPCEVLNDGTVLVTL